MRPANRKIKKLLYKERCIHVGYDENFIFYCKENLYLGPDCSEGCPKYETADKMHLTNMQCRKFIHTIEKCNKLLRNGGLL